jgi:predicted RNA-binding Zn-ribbon protein involved in translation (DUF1610 family)
MIFKCPGAQRFTQPQPEIIKCTFCSEEVEIWTNEVQATCPNCKKIVMRQQDTSCLDWCKYAKECVGEQVYSKYIKNRAIIKKQRITKGLEEHFGGDKKDKAR